MTRQFRDPRRESDVILLSGHSLPLGLVEKKKGNVSFPPFLASSTCSKHLWPRLC